MEKEFVPYAEAFELRDVGFDEPCICGYSKSTEQLETYSRFLVTKDSFTVDAPTFSQAFRWFRKKYQIVCVIDFYNDGDLWEDTMYTVTISEFEHFKSHDSFVQFEYKTYEEAELACLRKLIDLTKEILNEKRSRGNHG